MNTIFEAQEIYENGLYDGGVRKSERLIDLLRRKEPGRTQMACKIIRTDMMNIERTTK